MHSGRQHIIFFPFSGTNSLCLRSRVTNNFKDTLPCCLLTEELHFKDCLPKEIIFIQVYQFKHSSHIAIYYDKTKHYLKITTCEHLAIPLTKKPSSKAQSFLS